MFRSADLRETDCMHGRSSRPHSPSSGWSPAASGLPSPRCSRLYQDGTSCCCEPPSACCPRLRPPSGGVVISLATLREPSGLMSANTGVKQNAMLSMVAALLPPNGEDMVKIRSTGSPLARRPRATTPHRECSVIRHQDSGIGLFISKSVPSGWYLFDGETIIWLSRFNNTR